MATCVRCCPSKSGIFEQGFNFAVAVFICNCVCVFFQIVGCGSPAAMSKTFPQTEKSENKLVESSEGKIDSKRLSWPFHGPGSLSPSDLGLSVPGSQDENGREAGERWVKGNKNTKTRCSGLRVGRQDQHKHEKRKGGRGGERSRATRCLVRTRCCWTVCFPSTWHGRRPHAKRS